MKTTNNLLPVIMAGGSGTRLWPLSRELHPKQFLPLVDEKSMLQATLARLTALPVTLPIVICNEAHRFLAAEQLRELNLLNQNVILEPTGRNTAPAVALAALHATRNGADPLLLVLAADHAIQNEEAFRQAVVEALPHAIQGRLVTFGIIPNSPETGYGYIRQGEELIDGGFKVSAFIEKPERSEAENYLASGEYLWNSGMFLMRASQYLSELNHYRPDILKSCQEAIETPTQDMDFIRINRNAFAGCPAESIDYAVMEKTDSAVVIPIEVGWSDVGAFSSLWDLLPKNSDGNVVRGDVITSNSRDNLLFSENALVVTVGVDNLVVVQTKDAILVASRDKVQEVKNIVAELKSLNRVEHKLHRQVYRPWGYFDCVDASKRYQVKRITVAPGARLSLQMHHHRAEHWIVVNGTGRVTLNNQEQMLTENESIYLPIGSQHALENPGKIPLELIEVQVGSYLGEDDIVRFEDLYGRLEKNQNPHQKS